MWYQQNVSAQIARVSRTYMVENKGVSDRNIGVPPVRKYANYRTLLSLSLHVLIFIVIVVIIISTITLLYCRQL